jgi:hypothetical protein
MRQIPCEKCTGKSKECTDAVSFESKVVGKMLVPGVHQYKCPQCKSRLISYEGARTLFNYVKGKEADAVKSLPIGEFITAAQAIEILGVSKQAFSKNPRIKRGMILSVGIDGRNLYHKKSVELFKELNDGRFMVNSAEAPKIVYKEVFILPSQNMPRYKHKSVPLHKTINTYGVIGLVDTPVYPVNASKSNYIN